ncbi:MAG: tRNA (adenosine(37)-N6)-dimethylallyltransferase MiaA [Hydrocarboniphaga effusa]|nr:tRNA (adenosine(37)-N6)-dimethylallyltransferase MiaA [Hydrocarboniphaga effusa]
MGVRPGCNWIWLSWIVCFSVAANASKSSPVVLLMGPTASGKSGLALALAEKLAVEIISVDSAQVYRGMDIGSAKPSPEIRARVKHHLIDILDPAEPYSAACFREDALRLIAEIRARGHVPLLVGGTMLYFRALQQGLSELPPADAALRARITADAARSGWPALHERLARLDPASAARLHPNDSQRIQRALEIIALTGQAVGRAQERAGSGGLSGRVIKLGLNPPERALLHEQIARRFRQMMEQGFLEEVTRLRARGDLHTDLPSMRAVGYRQLWGHLDGRYDLAAAVEQGIAATRQLAKRQLTWLRAEPRLLWLDPAQPGLLAQALGHVHGRKVESAC